MEMIAKFLRQFLMHNDLAYIPGLGIFEAQNLKAELDPGKKQMAPPVRTVKFRQQTSKDLGFIDFLSRIERKSADDTKKELKKWVDGLKKEIVSQKKVEIEGLGHLGLNSAKKVVFKALPDLNLSADTLGMQPVKAEPVAKREVPAAKKAEEKKEEPKKEEPKKEAPKKEVPKKEAPKKEEAKKEEIKKEAAPAPAAAPVKKIEEKKPEPPKADKKPEPVKAEGEKEKKKNPLTLVLIIIGILILFSVAAYYFLNQMDTTQPVQVAEEVVEDTTAVEEEPVQETTPVEETKPEPEPEPEPTVTISDKTGRYYIVANSFEIEKNAYNFREDVISRGATDAKIILPDNKIRLYRVTIAESDDRDDAISKMEGLRSEFGNTIWVLSY